MTRHFTIDDEDKQLFRAAVADAKRLPAKPVLSKPRPKPKAHFTRAAERETLEESLAGLPDPNEPLLGDGLWYARPGVQDATLRKRRRGYYSIGAELDLHGLRAEAARIALLEFIQMAHDRRIRCVRIIHGKGYRSGPRGPVLKQKLNGWLRQRDDVLAFCSARVPDGGTGAAYVLLRNRK